MNVVCYLVYFKILHLTLCLKQHPRFGWLIIKETGTKSQKYLSNIGTCMLVFFSDCSYLCCSDVFFIHFLFTMLVRNQFEIFEVASKYKFYIKFDFGSLLILPGGYFCCFFFLKNYC